MHCHGRSLRRCSRLTCAVRVGWCPYSFLDVRPLPCAARPELVQTSTGRAGLTAVCTQLAVDLDLSGYGGGPLAAAASPAGGPGRAGPSGGGAAPPLGPAGGKPGAVAGRGPLSAAGLEAELELQLLVFQERPQAVRAERSSGRQTLAGMAQSPSERTAFSCGRSVAHSPPLRSRCTLRVRCGVLAAVVWCGVRRRSS